MMKERSSDDLIWSDGTPLLYESWTDTARRLGHWCFHLNARSEYAFEESDCEIQKRVVCEFQGKYSTL